MNTTRMMEIAVELAHLYRQRAETSTRIGHVREDVANRIIAMTPADGWPGKNQEQRDQAKATAVMGDQACQEMQYSLRANSQELSQITGDIEALEAERRALEWSIRGQLAEALAGKRESNGAPVEEAAFDEAANEAMIGAAEDAIFAGGPYPNGKTSYAAAPVAGKRLTDEPGPALEDELPF